MAKSQATLFWYDYETSGIDSRRDRIFQVAGIRTNLNFEVVNEPVNIFCKPARDFLPHPEACLVTGITPQIAEEQGISETEFCHKLNKQLMQSNTCTLGYNSLSFDDEFTRNLMYRNLRDPYAREWQNGNSRWDLIDLVRCAYALRPDGINWPVHDNGKPSFKLEDLSKANDIKHEQAHDALSDVYATIAIAALIREKQPKLFNYVFSHRDKNSVFKILSVNDPKPVMYISSYTPVAQGCMSVVIPIANHPQNKNGVIVYDLQYDPEEFLALDKEQLQKLLFVADKDLPAGQNRLPLKLISANKCPVLVPLNTVDDKTRQRFNLNIDKCHEYASVLSSAQAFKKLASELFTKNDSGDQESEVDPELALYSGGFFNNDDRSRMNKLHYMSPDQLSEAMHFEDPRIQKILLRYRARNYPDLLDDSEKQQWESYRQQRLMGLDNSGALSMSEFTKAIDQQKQSGHLTSDQLKVMDQLQAWGELITSDFKVDIAD